MYKVRGVTLNFPEWCCCQYSCILKI